MIITMASISEKEPDKEQDTLNTTVETILESDDDHSIHQVQATIDNDIVENCEQVSTTALDSDRKPNLPKLVDDIVIDTDNAESHINNYTLNDSDDTQHIDNQAEYDDFDDFGSFDSQIEEDNDDEFDAFDDDIIEEAFDNTPIFNNSTKEAIDSWENVLNQLYPYKLEDSFTHINSPKSIRFYVLEEAPESLHSRLTWDLVTKYMDNDNSSKIKVKWDQSEIESRYLIALSCKRSTTKIISSSSPDVLPVQKPTPIDTTKEEEPIKKDNNQPIMTTLDEKRSSLSSSVFSSISRFLPHLSKSNLPPKSPTSPTNERKWTPPLTPSNSIPRNKSIAAVNNLNIVPQQTTIKRSNTVAFSSSSSSKRTIADSPIITGRSTPPYINTSKPRPTSFHSSATAIQQNSTSSSNYLFDLSTILQTTASSELNTSFKPLIPVISSSAKGNTPLPPITNVNYYPGNTMDITTKTDVSVLPDVTNTIDDEFGGFSGEQDAGAALDDLLGSSLSSYKNNTFYPSSSNTVTEEDDPFGLNSVMMISQEQKHLRSRSSPVFMNNNNMISPTNILSPTRAVLSPTPSSISSPTRVFTPVMSPERALSPTRLSPSSNKASPIMQFNAAPTAIAANNNNKQSTADPFDYCSSTTSSLPSVFDMPHPSAATVAVDDQQVDEDDEVEWGDWAS